MWLEELSNHRWVGWTLTFDWPSVSKVVPIKKVTGTTFAERVGYVQTVLGGRLHRKGMEYTIKVQKKNHSVVTGKNVESLHVAESGLSQQDSNLVNGKCSDLHDRLVSTQSSRSLISRGHFDTFGDETPTEQRGLVIGEADL